MPNKYVVTIDLMNLCIIAPHQVHLNRLYQCIVYLNRYQKSNQKRFTENSRADQTNNYFEFSNDVFQ